MEVANIAGPVLWVAMLQSSGAFVDVIIQTRKPVLFDFTSNNGRDIVTRSTTVDGVLAFSLALTRDFVDFRVSSGGEKVIGTSR